jgi:hypothetical protein
VPKQNKRILNQNIIEQWPEIFSDIDLSAVPLDYLHNVVITFRDGNQWNVVIKKQDRDIMKGDLPKELTELFNNYEKQIVNVDFQLDVPQIKKDVMKSTKRFLRGKK